MKEIALHILDIIQNSVQAGAELVHISLNEDSNRNLLSLEIEDNGRGMSKEVLAKVNDPFFTTREKKTGLGIPLLKQQCEACGGFCMVSGEEGKGTLIKAGFMLDHIDRQPLGDITATLISVIRCYPEVDFIYTHEINDLKYSFDTRIIKEELQDIQINNNEVVNFLKEMISDNLYNLKNQKISV